MKYIDGEKLIARIQWLKKKQDITLRERNILIDVEIAIDALAEEHPVTDCDTLREAAENIYKTPFGTRAEDIIAGAEWQKEQMMEEAVEAKIYGYDDGSFELIASWLDMPKNSIYKDGQKVRIIIVEEDKQ